MNKLLRKNIWSLLFFEILYRSVLFRGTLYLADRLISILLKSQNYSYMTAENYSAFMSNPMTMALIAAGICALTLALIWESMAVLTAFMYSRQNLRCSMPELFWRSLRGSLSAVRRFPFGLLLTGLGAIPYLTFPFWFIEVFQIRLLNVSAAGLIERFPTAAVIAAGVALMTASVLCAMVLGEMLSLDIPAAAAWKKVCALWKDTFIPTLQGVLGSCIFCWLIIGIALLTGSMVIAVIIYFTTEPAYMVSAALIYGKNFRKLLGILGGSVQLIVFMRWNISLHLSENLKPVRYGEFLKGKALPGRLHLWQHMRLISFITAGILIAAEGWNLYTMSSFSGNQTLRAGELHVTAHRGGAWLAPENTLSAIHASGQSFADYAEVDVQETKDGQIILLHDGSLKRTAGVNRNIWTLTLEEVQQLDVGTKFGGSYCGETVPTLKEAIRCAQEENLMLNIEVKFNGHNKNMVKKVIRIIEEQDFLDSCVLTSMNYEFLVKAKRENPDIRTGYTMTMAYGDLSGLDAADFFSVKYTYIDEAFVEKIHGMGKEVHAWTLNNSSIIKRMVDCGVDNIITDEPGLVHRVILGKMDSNPGFIPLFKYLIKWK